MYPTMSQCKDHILNKLNKLTKQINGYSLWITITLLFVIYLYIYFRLDKERQAMFDKYLTSNTKYDVPLGIDNTAFDDAERL